MIELRWLSTIENKPNPESLAVFPQYMKVRINTLQYRTDCDCSVDEDGNITLIWSDWQDVPTVDPANE